MSNYLAPAVYVEETSFRAPSIEGVGTTTTAFAGPALTGPAGGTPQVLSSFGDFQSIYGGFDQLGLTNNPTDPQNVNYLALSVKAFFDNGGSVLYVSRVFSPSSGSGVASASFPATVSGTNPQVTATARFPGTFANFQQATLSLVAAKTTIANLGALPPGSLVATATPPSSLATLSAAGGAADTTIAITIAFAETLPAYVLIDSEIVSVTAIDATKMKLTVTRGAAGTTAAAHALGAPVYAALGTLASAVAVSATTITLGAAPSGTLPATITIGAETLVVSAASGASLTTSATTLPHASGDPVFAGATSAYYGNGAGSTFANASNTALPATLPAGVTLYVLTMTATTHAASSAKVTVNTTQPALVYTGLGFDAQNHPNYLGLTLGPTPPRPIDALQNQVAFSVTNVATPFALLSALFGNWSGPGTTQPPMLFPLNGGNDGAIPQATDYDNALTPLDALEDVAIVATPGSAAFPQAEAILQTLIAHVTRARAYRVAVLDAPFGGLAADYENVRAQIDTSYAALYVPWVQMANPLAKSGTAIPSVVYVPPSGFVAGIYARSDQQNSVAKAPANEVVTDALDFERRITYAEQSVLNPLGINCLRYFPDRGFRVWGARTASSDSEFMYVNVRRYLIYLEHSIDNSTQWAVFENNGPALWARVKDAIDSFLNAEFVAGNLLGTAPANAYFVRCDRSTMTQNDLDNGRMICLIGVSVLKPAEFVIFRIGQWTASSPS